MNSDHQVTFLHTADLHLGSPFSSIKHLSKNIQNSLLSASEDSFNAFVHYAITHRVHFILISGDVFDTSTPTLKVQNNFISQLEKLSSHDIMVFLICGNHDAKIIQNHRESLSRIKNLFVFNDSIESIEFTIHTEKFKVHGVNFISDLNLKEQSKNIDLDPDSFHICMLHADVAKSQRQAAIKKYSELDVNELLEIPVDYWALGHLHAFDIMHVYPHIVYPGTIQGRSLKSSEQGVKGFTRTVIENNQIISCSLIPISAITFEEIHISYKIHIQELLFIARDITEILYEAYAQKIDANRKYVLIRAQISILYDTDLAQVKPLTVNDLSHLEEVIREEFLKRTLTAEIIDLDWVFVNTIQGDLAKELYEKSIEQALNLLRNDTLFVSKSAKLRQKFPVLERTEITTLEHMIEKELKRVLIGL